MSIENVAWSGLQYCNVCLSNTDPDYLAYNIVVSGFILAAVGAVGLVGNVFVVIIYTSAEQRIHSTSIYLAALGVSDFSLILIAMFLFVLEAWRHHGPLTLAWTYARGATFIFPLGVICQMTSVYFCIAVTVDCFISVVLPSAFKRLCCTAKNAKIVVLVLTVLCILYNIPHFFELQSIECLQSVDRADYGSLMHAAIASDSDDKIVVKSLQLCPTEIRNDMVYYTVYYTYMYTTFMAVGPLVLLIVLNIFVVITVMKNGASENSDTVSLILVVFLFILCNLTALVVNFLELVLYDTSLLRQFFPSLKLKYVIVYLVDLSNLLVIINATANFFVYLIFGASFRQSFKNLCGQSFQRKMKEVRILAPTSLVKREDETRFMTLSSPSSPHTVTSFGGATSPLVARIERWPLERPGGDQEPLTNGDVTRKI